MSTESRSASSASARHAVLLASTIDMSNIFYEGIVQELRNRQWDVHVVSSPGPTGERSFGREARIHSLQMERGLSPIRDILALVRWVKLLAKVRPQVLVIGTPKASLLGGLAARILRTPHIVYVIHGLRAQETSGPLAIVLKIVERLTLRSAHRILAVSESLRSDVEQVHPTFQNRIEVLGSGSLNGVDMTRFVPAGSGQQLDTRQHLGLPEASFIVGFVGRFHRDKGGNFLLNLIQNEASRRLGLHLMVIGDIEDEALRDEVDQLSAQGLITVTGWVDHPEKLISGMDLLLHPTRREGLGMVLLEAQASGIPVLTNRVTGTVDAVQSGVGGYFADTDSIPSWIDQISTLVADVEQRRLTGLRGRAFVMERYDRSIVVPRFVDYLSVLSSASENILSSGKQRKRKSAK